MRKWEHALNRYLEGDTPHTGVTYQFKANSTSPRSRLLELRLNRATPMAPTTSNRRAHKVKGGGAGTKGGGKNVHASKEEPTPSVTAVVTDRRRPPQTSTDVIDHDDPLVA
jgi:hypothetical protein